MLKNLKTYLIIALAIIFSSSASANSAFSQTTITSVIVHDHGNVILIKLADNVTNNEGCSINNQMVVKKSHPFFKEMYTALLSAFHAGSKIHGWVNTCYDWDMPTLTRLDLTK